MQKYGVELSLLLKVFPVCIFLFFSAPAWSQEYSKPSAPPRPLHEVGSLGAATTGALVDGVAGATRKGCRYRFTCHTEGPKPGFLGPITVAKPTSLRCQPGIFPAPLTGPDSITFTFTCQSNDNLLTPVVVRPDGTTLQGFPMSTDDFPQSIVLASPAQTGIYTLFVLPHEQDNGVHQVYATVDVKTSTHSQQDTTLILKPFESTEENSEWVSGEFIYTSSI